MADSIQAPISAADEAAVEAVRQKFGDAAAAQFWTDLYKQRHAPPPGSRLLSTFPRWIVVLIAIWVGLLETADKLPKLLLTVPQYQATLAQYRAQEMQPELVTAQLQKAKFDAKAAAYQPDLTATQLDKTKFEAKAAGYQPDLAETQLEKSKLETAAAAYQPDTAKAQLDKTRQDAKAASFQPALVAAQAFKAEVDSVASGSTIGESGVALDNMFDLLDPNHPNMVSRGIAEPDVSPLIPFYHARKASADGSSQQANAAPPPTPAPSAPASDETSTTSLRKPAMFDCNRAFLPADYVICASPELLDAEARLEDAYTHARATLGDTVKMEQREWIKSYGVQCGLPSSGRPSQDDIGRATACIHGALNSRVSRLNSEAP